MKRVAACVAAVVATACSTVASPPDGPAVAVPQVVAPPAPAAPAPLPPDPARYTCDGGRVLSLRPSADTLSVEGLDPGPVVLLRDAGGVGPQQSVWSSERLRVELGLGADGREAVVHVLQPQPMQLQCRSG